MPTAVEMQHFKLCVEQTLDELATQLMVSGSSSIKPEALETLRGQAEEGGFKALAETAAALAN
jgi:hypothetical protein